jgi:hypothetical protein
MFGTNVALNLRAKDFIMIRKGHTLGVLTIAWIIWMQDVERAKWQPTFSASIERDCYARMQSVKDSVSNGLRQKELGVQDPGGNRLLYYLSDWKPRELLFFCYPSDFDPRPR